MLDLLALILDVFVSIADCMPFFWPHIVQNKFLAGRNTTIFYFINFSRSIFYLIFYPYYLINGYIVAKF